MTPKRTAAQTLVEVLIAQGVERVFCVPGESFLPVLDALHDAKDRIDTIVCRHEAAAANMAEATGKLTGRPGVVFVTRGPGATHAAIGVHTAKQDSSPMILFIGQIARGDREREAFQEVDYRAVFGTLAKWATEIDDADRVPELVERAFHVAMQGRAGPVVIALPEDMLADETSAWVGGRIEPARAAPDPAAIREIGKLLSASEKPLLVLGGSGWDAASAARAHEFARQANIPILLSFRRKHLIDNRDPLYCGDLGLGCNPKLTARVKEADLILAIGARLGENPTQGYSLFDRATTARKLIHIHPDAAEIGRVWPARVGLVAAPSLATEALCGLSIAPRPGAWLAGARADYEAFSTPVDVKGAVNLSLVFAHFAEALPEGALVANDAGNFATWLHRFYRHCCFGTQIGPTSGAMGYALPALIAAKLARPDEEAFAVLGDGCFGMAGAELATAMRHKLGIVVLVIDNSSYGTIRMHQERNYPGRNYGTDLVNPDFVAFAKSFGAWGAKVARTEEFPAALAAARDAAKATNAPALLHIVTDVEDIAPGVSISSLRT